MSKTKEEKAKMPKKKHRFLKAIPAMIAIIIVAGALDVGGSMIANRNFTTSFYQIASDKVSDNIRIVELADLHNNEFGKNNSKLVEKIRLLKPDIIVYAGDMINEEDGDYSTLFNLSDKLCIIAPVYACYGNNEMVRQLFYDSGFADKLKEHNVCLLSNEKADVMVKHTVVEFVAISDNPQQFDISTNNSKKFIEGLEATDNCRICLTHYPELFNDKLLNRDIDIAFTGHAHGGLIRIPHFGGLYSTGEGFMPNFTEGVVETQDATQVVVSRGLGNSGVIPRINNQPELVVVDICWY